MTSFSISNVQTEEAVSVVVYDSVGGGGTGPTGSNFIFQNNPPINETKLENTYLDGNYNLYADSSNGFPQLLNLPIYYTGTVINVSDETQFNNALSSSIDYDIINITNNLTLTGIKTINKKLKIQGSTDDINITFSSTTNIFTITSSEVWITNLTFNNSNLSSNANILGFNNVNGILNFVTNCIFNTNEFAIITNNSLIQITDNEFNFLGTPPDSHRYIYLTGCLGTCYIANNLFIGSSATAPYVTRCIALAGVSSSYLNSKIVITGNTTGEESCQQFFICDISLAGSNSSFYFADNVIKCVTGYIIFFANPVLSGIKNIFVFNNTELLPVEATGSKGLIALDSAAAGTISFNTNIYSSRNTIPNLRDDYIDLVNSIAEQPRVIAYNSARFSPGLETYNLILPLLTNIVGPQAPVFIGTGAGQINQNIESIAIGINSGNINQNNRSIAIGLESGNQYQGNNCIAIGTRAGFINQHSNSIILNASGIALNSSTTGSCYINPIRNVGANTGESVLTYSGNEVRQGTKTFVINHPINDDKYLVHGCIEGPEAGVYYRGQNKILENNEIIVKLPEYTKQFYNWTVNLTLKGNNWNKNISVSDVINQEFTVYGENNTEFFWTVYGQRQNIEVEPVKLDYNLYGNGPYTYIEKK
jgi:hypothetical protein